MIRIEIVSTSFDDRVVPNKANPDKPWQFREQSGYAFLMDPEGKPMKYPIACAIPLEKDQAPYPVGFYTLDSRSIYVGDFRKLELGRVRLVPEQGAARRAA